jgi:hypothetical protein
MPNTSAWKYCWNSSSHFNTVVSFLFLQTSSTDSKWKHLKGTSSAVNIKVTGSQISRQLHRDYSDIGIGFLTKNKNTKNAVSRQKYNVKLHMFKKIHSECLVGCCEEYILQWAISLYRIWKLKSFAFKLWHVHLLSFSLIISMLCFLITLEEQWNCILKCCVDTWFSGLVSVNTKDRPTMVKWPSNFISECLSCKPVKNTQWTMFALSTVH